MIKRLSKTTKIHSLLIELLYFEYLKINNIVFPCIPNLKCTPWDRQMYPRLGTPAIDCGSFCQCITDAKNMSATKDPSNTMSILMFRNRFFFKFPSVLENGASTVSSPISTRSRWYTFVWPLNMKQVNTMGIKGFRDLTPFVPNFSAGIEMNSFCVLSVWGIS